jgi:hypothetical protein
MSRLVLENFEDFIDYVELNEKESDPIGYTFVTNNVAGKDRFKTGPAEGFGSSLKEIQDASNAGAFDKTPGFEKGMKLEDWAKTDGYKECEELLLKYAGNQSTKDSLKVFKEKKPTLYIAAVLYMTHSPLKKSFTKGEGRFSPLGRGGGGLLGKIKHKVYASDYGTQKKEEKKDPTKGGGNATPLKLEFDKNLDTSEFFPDNSWTLSDKFKTTAQEAFTKMIKPAIDAAQPADPKDPKAYLQEIKVTASCSTVTNTASPEDKKVHTFKELADLRAKSAVDYFEAELKKLGVLIDKDTKVIIETDGENKGKKVVTGYGSLTKGTDLTGTSGPEWNGKNNAELKKYQQIHISAEILINTSKPVLPAKDDKNLDPNTIPPKDDFKVVASYGTHEFTPPTIEFHPLQDLKDWFWDRDKRRHRGSVRCPRFR